MQTVKSWKEELKALVDSLEKRIGLCVTFNDMHGFFCDKEGKSYIHPDNAFHNLDFCQSADRKKCHSHENKKGNALAAEKDAPYLTNCWQGPLQIAVPLKWHGHNVGVIYLGPFKTDSAENLDLPFYDLADFYDDALLLEAVGMGIVEKTVSSKIHGKGERWEKVFRLYTSRLGEKIGIRDVAEELNLSPSRASHLVKELFGMSFEQVLLEHRLRRTAALLESTDLTHAEIAELVGFCDIYHMSKMFKRKFKIPPGQFRKESRKIV